MEANIIPKMIEIVYAHLPEAWKSIIHLANHAKVNKDTDRTMSLYDLSLVDINENSNPAIISAPS